MSLEQSESSAEDTRFGLLPFDLFALEKWDYNAPSSKDESKRQWEHLAWEYQSFTLFQRWPYYKPLIGAVCVCPAPASKELAERILSLNQTAQERRISADNFCSGWAAPLWLRTCYDPSLAAKYKEMETLSDVIGTMERRVLDNEALYAFEDGDDSWRRVFVRIPAFTKFIGGRPVNEDEEDEDDDDDDDDETNFQYNNGQTNEAILEQTEAEPDERVIYGAAYSP
ncbi:hypothetical protein BDV18DRAFT_159795 [Aspergillus unguis]